MKKFSLFAICVMVCLLAGCEQNEPTISNKVETGNVIEISRGKVTIQSTSNVNVLDYQSVSFGIMYSDKEEDLKNHKGIMLEASYINANVFNVTIIGLKPNTTYYYCTWILLNDKLLEYGKTKDFLTENFTYDFSVSSSKKVAFSSGNLQYKASTKTWRFAPSQLEYIGQLNENISSTYDSWIDLFCWGTGDDPTNYMEDANAYTKFADWGINTIGNDAPNTWRVLTNEEWEYLRFKRDNSNFLCGIAEVNGIRGLVLLPDDWECPMDITFKSGFYMTTTDGAGMGFEAKQKISESEWIQMESVGAIFLPASGWRKGNSFKTPYDIYPLPDNGRYWSATEKGSNTAYYFYLGEDEAKIYSNYRYHGYSVRLVKDVK